MQTLGQGLGGRGVGGKGVGGCIAQFIVQEKDKDIPIRKKLWTAHKHLQHIFYLIASVVNLVYIYISFRNGEY